MTLLTEDRVFPRPFTHGRDLSPPYGGGGQVQGDKVLMRGTHERGPNFDRLYHQLKVLLLLSCNYKMQFIGYDCIKTR